MQNESIVVYHSLKMYIDILLKYKVLGMYIDGLIIHNDSFSDIL